jgi:hypothetical protein
VVKNIITLVVVTVVSALLAVAVGLLRNRRARHLGRWWDAGGILVFMVLWVIIAAIVWLI